MYRELITEASRGNTWVKLQPPCAEEQIRAAEKQLGCRFPQELRVLLAETDGDGWLLLSLQGMLDNAQRNREIFLPLFEEDFTREEYEERVGRFLFFATNGCGDYYCYRITQEGFADDSVIYEWDHEELGEACCWKPVAGSLRELIVRYYSDAL